MQGDKREYFVERIKDIAVARVFADEFSKLPLKEKILAYYLSKAAIIGELITYDQCSKFALEIKQLLEQIIKHQKDIPLEIFEKIENFTKLFWIHHGNHHARTFQKIFPEFTKEELFQAAKIAFKKGSAFGVNSEEELETKLNFLEKPLFDKDFEPIVVNKSPPIGHDIITASSNNFYENVTLKDLENFEEKYILNSKVIKKNDQLEELPWRAGNNSIPPGIYSPIIKGMIYYLKKSLPYADTNQQKVMETLIEFFEAGDNETFDKYNILWVKHHFPIDFILGFIEEYKDARCKKGEFEGIVYYTDYSTNKIMEDLSQHAEFLEQHAPWKKEYKRTGFKPPKASAIAVVTETGGAGPISWAGINLPNKQSIREQYGSKSVLLSTVMESTREVLFEFSKKEFYTPEEQKLLEKYGRAIRNSVVALHEVVGHGSGKVNPKLEKDPRDYLQEYYSTLEEARADLVALWHMWNPKLKELNIIPDDECCKLAYYTYAMGDLTILYHVQHANEFHEDHMRAHHLIIQYIKDTKKCIEFYKEDSKTKVKVTDYEKMREGVGELLSELMRIKAEGDFKAAKDLINKYGILFDIDLRDEIVARCTKINLPHEVAHLTPILEPVIEKGEIKDIKLIYPKSLKEHQLKHAEIQSEINC